MFSEAELHCTDPISDCWPEPDVSPGVHQDTVWSEVSVEETHMVEILQSQDQLTRVELDHSLGESHTTEHCEAPDSQQIENIKHF